ncbi:hypothetical protein JVT61DRAFT_15017 [Boletus reticuloceps]|uniref:Uncharacterized protein n=1 Tax=Boletus reticuloceps TaxID=495285 RepID=A0A8I3A254_9AGAM|nr:hypothetical protein JVT61DRAFT_15017 [Boletus reticuloceps]
MILKQLTSPTSALPSRPERPFKYVWPVTTQDGSVGYDRPLENYFDPSMAQRILPAVPSGRLYDTVARAHDFRYQVTPNMLWSTPRPLKLTERRRSLAKVSGDSPDYMGISPDLPGWHPRRSPHEDRRGTVSVTPKEVNSLVPYIPPIDTSFPPPKEWLDAMAKHILADAHADLNDSHNNDPTSSDPSTESDDTFFDYDTDSTLDAATVPRTSIPQPPQSESDHDADFNSNTDTDTETDTDIDMENDDAYDRHATPTSYSGPGAEWLIRRNRPSIVFSNNKNVTLRSGGGDRYRRRGGKIGFPGGISKTPRPMQTIHPRGSLTRVPPQTSDTVVPNVPRPLLPHVPHHNLEATRTRRRVHPFHLSRRLRCK